MNKPISSFTSCISNGWSARAKRCRKSPSARSSRVNRSSSRLQILQMIYFSTVSSTIRDRVEISITTLPLHNSFMKKSENFHQNHWARTFRPFSSLPLAMSQKCFYRSSRARFHSSLWIAKARKKRDSSRRYTMVLRTGLLYHRQKKMRDTESFIPNYGWSNLPAF